MSAPIDHKKPTLAFVLLFVIATTIMAQTLRARADESPTMAVGPGRLTVRGTLPADRAPATRMAPMARVLTVAPAAHAVPATPTRALGHEGDSVAGSPVPPALPSHAAPRTVQRVAAAATRTHHEPPARVVAARQGHRSTHPVGRLRAAVHLAPAGGTRG
ncbi:MAG: hypothetical protein ACXVWU_08595 [Nocardioides sp.]